MRAVLGGVSQFGEYLVQVVVRNDRIDGEKKVTSRLVIKETANL